MRAADVKPPASLRRSTALSVSRSLTDSCPSTDLAWGILAPATGHSNALAQDTDWGNRCTSFAMR